MEKVLRVRVKGISIEGDEEIQMGGQVYRFIGDDEVNNAEKQLTDDWIHYSQAKFAPSELHFKFERLDIGKELNYSLTREFIDNTLNPMESLIRRIRKAVDECE